MQAKPRQLTEPTLLTASAASYYQAPSNKRVMITKVTVSNTDTANARTFDIHVVPSGDTATSTNKLVTEKVLDEKESISAYQVEGQILNPGDSIHAKASVASVVSLMISGVEIIE